MADADAAAVLVIVVRCLRRRRRFFCRLHARILCTAPHQSAIMPPPPLLESSQSEWDLPLFTKISSLQTIFERNLKVRFKQQTLIFVYFTCDLLRSVCVFPFLNVIDLILSYLTQ